MNLATVFTLSRVIIAPFLLMYLSADTVPTQMAAIWKLVSGCMIEISDLLDGTIARARHDVTDFGNVFYPIADSVSRQTVFISFMVSGIIPLWMYLIFFYRDAFMQLLRIVCASSGVVLAARKSGKAKAVLQGIATFGVIAVIALQRMYQVKWIPAQFLGFHPAFWVMLLPTIYTLLSVIDYVIPNRL